VRQPDFLSVVHAQILRLVIVQIGWQLEISDFCPKMETIAFWAQLFYDWYRFQSRHAVRSQQGVENRTHNTSATLHLGPSVSTQDCLHAWSDRLPIINKCQTLVGEGVFSLHQKEGGEG
jgi:hypothetical protein